MNMEKYRNEYSTAAAIAKTFDKDVREYCLSVGIPDIVVSHFQNEENHFDHIFHVKPEEIESQRKHTPGSILRIKPFNEDARQISLEYKSKRYEILIDNRAVKDFNILEGDIRFSIKTGKKRDYLFFEGYNRLIGKKITIHFARAQALYHRIDKALSLSLIGFEKKDYMQAVATRGEDLDPAILDYRADNLIIGGRRISESSGDKDWIEVFCS